MEASMHLMGCDDLVWLSMKLVWLSIVLHGVSMKAIYMSLSGAFGDLY